MKKSKLKTRIAELETELEEKKEAYQSAITDIGILINQPNTEAAVGVVSRWAFYFEAMDSVWAGNRGSTGNGLLEQHIGTSKAPLPGDYVGFGNTLVGTADKNPFDEKVILEHIRDFTKECAMEAEELLNKKAPLPKDYVQFPVDGTGGQHKWKDQVMAYRHKGNIYYRSFSNNFVVRAGEVPPDFPAVEMILQDEDMKEIYCVRNSRGEVWSVGDEVDLIDVQRLLKINKFFEREGKLFANFNGTVLSKFIDNLEKPEERKPLITTEAKYSKQELIQLIEKML